MPKRRLILTNVNSSVFKPRFCPTFLSDLIVNALLFDEVLIREADLIGNRKLTQFLRDDFNFQIFAELLSVGAVKILHLGPKAYPDNVHRDPRVFPISARAEDHELNRSYRGRPWKPTLWEWELFSRLDPVVRNSRARRKQRGFPEENRFAAELSELLLHRTQYRLHQRRAFRGIEPAMADKFVEFCSSADSWRRFLREAGVKEPVGAKAGFYRTEAFQCAEFFDPEGRRAMKRLVESTYAACECERENAEGRYGRGALTELPARAENYEETYEEVKKLDVVPLVRDGAFLKLAVAPGIGDVLLEVRSTEAFKEFQRFLWSMGCQDPGPYLDPGRSFEDAWYGVCAEYERAWSKHITQSHWVDKRVTRLALYMYYGLRLGGWLLMPALSVEMFGRQINGSIIVDPAVGVVIGVFPWLSQQMRTLVRMPAARQEMVNAAALRCTPVQLRS